MDWIGNYIEQMPTIPNFYLQDTSGQVWQLGATALDAYTTTPVTNPSGAASFLLQDSGTSQTWAMTVLTNGALHISPSPGLGQQYIPVISSTGLLVGIGVTNAAIVVMALCPDMPIVGTFFNPRTYIPRFSQPGGVGSPTFPQEATGELLGQWMAGCSHSFNSWEVAAASSCGTQVAVVQCPICSYVQQIISPYSAINQWPNDIIMG